MIRRGTASSIWGLEGGPEIASGFPPSPSPMLKPREVAWRFQNLSLPALLTWLSNSQLAKDIESFAHHAGRKSVNTEDVILSAHSNEHLAISLRSFCDKLKLKEPQSLKKRKKLSGKEAKAPTTVPWKKLIQEGRELATVWFTSLGSAAGAGSSSPLVCSLVAPSDRRRLTSSPVLELRP